MVGQDHATTLQPGQQSETQSQKKIVDSEQSDIHTGKMNLTLHIKDTQTHRHTHTHTHTHTSFLLLVIRYTEGNKRDGMDTLQKAYNPVG